MPNFKIGDRVRVKDSVNIWGTRTGDVVDGRSGRCGWKVDIGYAGYDPAIWFNEDELELISEPKPVGSLVLELMKRQSKIDDLLQEIGEKDQEIEEMAQIVEATVDRAEKAEAALTRVSLTALTVEGESLENYDRAKQAEEIADYWHGAYNDAEAEITELTAARYEYKDRAYAAEDELEELKAALRTLGQN